MRVKEKTTKRNNRGPYLPNSISTVARKEFAAKHCGS